MGLGMALLVGAVILSQGCAPRHRAPEGYVSWRTINAGKGNYREHAPTWCGTTKSTGVQVFADYGATCPDTGQVDRVVMAFLGYYGHSIEAAAGMRVLFTGQQPWDGGGPVYGLNARQLTVVWLRGRVWDLFQHAWGDTLWHELCHEMHPGDDSHKAGCYQARGGL